MVNNRDQIYRTSHSAAHGGAKGIDGAQESVKKFEFDEKVASVFEDMISRSVPGYRQILELIPTLVKQFDHNDSNYYDLGCSLGAGMLAISKGLSELPNSQSKIFGIDSSESMLDQAKSALEQSINKEIDYELSCADITETNIEHAAMALMNFTLQFIPLHKRDQLIQSIFDSLIDGGVLILSEKIKFDDALTNQTLIDIHHQYKADQGYSQLEISRKRDAIENVLIPETLETHKQRLKRAGFKVVTPWVQNLQFISLLAIK